MHYKYLLQSLFVVLVCAAAIAGSYHYSRQLQKKYMSSGNDCNHSSQPSGGSSKADDKAVGHLFWESVTRLIVSAQTQK